MAKWVVDNQVIEMLYGDNMHVEVIKRCGQVKKQLIDDSLNLHLFRLPE